MILAVGSRHDYCVQFCVDNQRQFDGIYVNDSDKHDDNRAIAYVQRRNVPHSMQTALAKKPIWGHALLSYARDTW